MRLSYDKERLVIVPVGKATGKHWMIGLMDDGGRLRGEDVPVGFLDFILAGGGGDAESVVELCFGDHDRRFSNSMSDFHG